jgi:hypothetical protein
MLLTTYAVECIMTPMLEILTTEEFAAWFRALDDDAAEDVATALQVVEELGPGRSNIEARERAPR